MAQRCLGFARTCGSARSGLPPGSPDPGRGSGPGVELRHDSKGGMGRGLRAGTAMALGAAVAAVAAFAAVAEGGQLVFCNHSIQRSGPLVVLLATLALGLVPQQADAQAVLPLIAQAERLSAH